MYITLTLIAYLIDRVFGEFKYNIYIKHPVVYMGNFIKYFEKRFYKDSVIRGTLLTLSLLFIVFYITYSITYFISNVYVLAVIASAGIASKMLYDSVKDIVSNPQNIKYLVSRDTKYLNNSDINKAAIETYGENFSDGIVAPLFYLFCFGIVGLFIYKAINTLDSMVGYRNERYEKFGKFSAILDDVVNYIPSRLTAIIIAILFGKINIIKKIFSYGKLHESPNAGYPISALGFSIGVKLGGDTSYFGKIKHKPNFSEGKVDISKEDILNSLKLRVRFDIFIVLILILLQIIL
ncbi:adenosylcobinamide-phosphate synthase CbiB [Arcobacter sp. 15-2]|uniref:adenosylcobinamide-phosphate synthase CbiB n=1 Tax=Arcobacter sp. 15-2 TaxID=3374109 RepID=UPI00399CDE32